jgi:hypothetical protein
MTHNRATMTIQNKFNCALNLALCAENDDLRDMYLSASVGTMQDYTQIPRFDMATIPENCSVIITGYATEQSSALRERLKAWQPSIRFLPHDALRADYVFIGWEIAISTIYNQRCTHMPFLDNVEYFAINMQLNQHRFIVVERSSARLWWFPIKESKWDAGMGGSLLDL